MLGKIILTLRKKGERLEETNRKLVLVKIMLQNENTRKKYELK